MLVQSDEEEKVEGTRAINPTAMIDIRARL